MAKVLYITANPKVEEQSFSLAAGRAFLNTFKEIDPQAEIVELDLYKANIPHIDEEVFAGWGKLQSGTAFNELSAQEQAKVARLGELAEQFVDADVYVFVTPMWNFSYPPIVKAYIDSICVAGKTFKYTEQGPVGLLAGKKAVHIQATGGVYSEGPAQAMNFADAHIRAVMGFVGIGDVDTVLVEGMAMYPDRAQEFKEKGIEAAKDVAKKVAAK
jgi:FMN-dependent NADH-azoreductase